MCKNLIVPNVSKLTKAEFQKFLRLSSKVLTNATDQDGFGYACFGSNGVFGERFLDVDNIDFALIVGRLSGVPNDCKKLFKDNDSNSFGTHSRRVNSLIAHARMSTNTVSLLNTHPFQSEKFTLIHNGVVEDEAPIKATCTSTCDSEILVRHLTDYGVNGMVANVSGYYCVAAIDNLSGELTIVKDARASLFGCFVPYIDSMMFATSDAQLRTLLKGMAWRHTRITEIRDNVAFVFDQNGTLLSESTISPRVEAPKVYDLPRNTYAKDEKASWRFNDTTRDTYEGYRDEYAGYGNEMPEADFDEKYTIIDHTGNQIAKYEFDMLPYWEQELCEIIDTASGNVVASYG